MQSDSCSRRGIVTPIALLASRGRRPLGLNMSLAMASDDRAAHTTPVTLLDGARVYYDDAERPTTIAGPVLAVGATPAEAAEAFLRANVHIFGVARENLLSGSLAGDAAPMREIMLLPDGTFRHTIVSFTQQLGGVPVFESELRLLVRNEPEHPLVLAASTLKPLGDFHFDPAVLKAPATAAGIREAQRVAPELKGARFGTPSLVIWAGEADVAAAPKLAPEVPRDARRPPETPTTRNNSSSPTPRMARFCSPAT